MSEILYSSFFSDANLLSYYRFEGNSNDSKGSVNGTDTNITYSGANGVYSQGGRSAGGTSDGINFGANFNFTSSAFSFVLWFYPEDFVTGDCIISNGQGGGWGYQWDFADASGHLQFYCNQSGANQKVISATAVTLNKWNHIAFTKTGSTGKMYINGSEVSYTDQPSMIDAVSSASNFYFMREQYSTGHSPLARFDEFAVFSDVLSAAEIKRIYLKTNASFLANFI